jgi:3D (Asp-Asp-Asp) domain-containing protein
MDRMQKRFSLTSGIVCLSAILQVGVMQIDGNGQSKATEPTTKASGSSTTATTSSDISSVTPNLGKLTSSTVLETGAPATLAPPRISAKNPNLNFKFSAAESKLSAENFKAPDELGAPLNFRATAYALSGRTRSGAYVRRGVIAADPRVLPLGSVVQVQAGKWSGVYTVHDTGGKIKGNIIDVWVPTTREARRFGRRPIKLHVLHFANKKRNATK